MSPSHLISSREENLHLILLCSWLGLETVSLPHSTLPCTGYWRTCMWGLRARDTHHPFLPLKNKIENIPLEVEWQQGWGANWGGKGDREEV